MTPDGFLLVDKEPGWTSHDVVAKLRGALRIKKIGHAGTLDPMATGLLVIGVGRATRLLRFVQSGRKVYVATAMFGVATDSLDADGAVLAREPMDVSEHDVRGAMERFVGIIHQVPPMVSARRIGGKRLYELAREGVEVERDARPVEIHDLRLVDFAPSSYPEVTFEVTCGTGTYVRTLADDIAVALGGHAHLMSLRRVANGSLDVDAAHPVDQIADAASPGEAPRFLLSPSEGLVDLPAVVIGDELARAVENGVPFGRSILDPKPDDGLLRMLDHDNRLLAVYSVAGGHATPEVVLS